MSEQYDLKYVNKNGRKPIFFTADLHISHLNSIKFDNRPFRDLDEMHKSLIKKYNAQVPANGICYFLGDIVTHNSEVAKEMLAQMNGKKICILGNHCKGVNALYQVGFDAVLNNATIYIVGQKVTMSHCPLTGLFREDIAGMKGSVEGDLWHGESKNQEFSVKNEGQFHLHGHIHSPNGGKSTKILNRQFDVGVVANNYKPVPISEIEAWIMKTLQEEKNK